MKFPPGKYETKRGGEAVVLEEFDGALFGRVQGESGEWFPAMWESNGNLYGVIGSADNLLTPEIVRYVNVYQTDVGHIFGNFFDSAQQADDAKDHHERIARIRITFREGQFDD